MFSADKVLSITAVSECGEMYSVFKCIAVSEEIRPGLCLALAFFRNLEMELKAGLQTNWQ